MSEVVHLRDEDDGASTWEVRRDGEAVGTARTQLRRGGQLLTALDVPANEAPAAFAAVGSALRERGEESVAVDVPPGHEVLSAALAGLDARLVATQMRLDLTRSVEAPDRVALLAMTREEFAGYREHLVTSYAQDMVGIVPTATTPYPK